MIARGARIGGRALPRAANGRFALPAAVLADQAKAGYENGVLKIDLPKAQPGKPKRIEITVG